MQPRAMHDGRYRSFLVRVWQPGGDGTIRVEVELIQTGKRTVLHGTVAEQVVEAIDPLAGSGQVPGPSPEAGTDAPPKGSRS